MKTLHIFDTTVVRQDCFFGIIFLHFLFSLDQGKGNFARLKLEELGLNKPNECISHIMHSSGLSEAIHHVVTVSYPFDQVWPKCKYKDMLMIPFQIQSEI